MGPVMIPLYNGQEGKEEAANGTDQELPRGRKKSKMWTEEPNPGWEPGDGIGSQR